MGGSQQHRTIWFSYLGSPGEECLEACPAKSCPSLSCCSTLLHWAVRQNSERSLSIQEQSWEKRDLEALNPEWQLCLWRDFWMFSEQLSQDIWRRDLHIINWHARRMSKLAPGWHQEVPKDMVKTAKSMGLWPSYLC